MFSRVVVAGALCLVLLTGVALAETHVVTVRNFEFDPSTLTIAPGDAVRWEWESGTHTTTNGAGSGAPDAGTLWDEPISSSDTQFTYTFNSAGTFPYFCRPHEGLGMTGSITVSSGSVQLPGSSTAGKVGLAALMLIGGALIITRRRRAMSNS